MRTLTRRVAVLESGSTEYLTLGEVLDGLDQNIDDGRRPSPALIAGLRAMSNRSEPCPI